MAKIGVLTIDLVGQIKGFETSMKKASSVAKQTAGQIDNTLTTSIDGTTAAVQRLASIAGVGLGVGAIINYADSFTELQNRLRLVTDSQEELTASTEDIFRIAQTTSQEMGSVGQVYQRIAQNADALGLSLDGVAKITETVSKAVAISGASAGAASAGLTQLGQALASGVLRGDEFNSIMENTTGIAQAIADGLGVPIGALRAMAEAGELTASTVVGALQKASDSIDEAFGTRIKTVAQSLVELQNAAGKFFGDLNNGVGVTSALATVISALANNLAAVTTAAGTFVAVKLVQHLAEVSKASNASAQAAKTLASANLLSARTAVAVAAEEVRKSAAYGGSTAAAANLALAERQLTIATTTYAAASRAATVASRAFAGALALVGGPLGAVSIAIGLGVAAWGAFGGASADAKDETVESIAAMNLSMDELILKFDQLSKAQQALLITKYTDKLIEDGEKIQSSLNGLLTSFMGVGTTGAAQLEKLGAATNQLNQLTKDATLSNDERYVSGLKIIDSLAQEGILTADNAAKIRDQWAETSSLVDKQKEHSAAINELRGSANAAATAMSALAREAQLASGASGKEWDKFVASLEMARDTAGMTAEQLAVYKAAAMGANVEQQKLIGSIAAQTTAVDDLKKAIVDGDAKAAKGAQDRLNALIAEQAQLVYNMVFAKAYLDLLALGITATSALQGAQAEASLESLKTMDNLQKQTKAIIANVKATSIPKAATAKKGGGGGKPKKSDEEKQYEREQKQFKDWIKNQKEKIAMMGTETEVEKIRAELMLGNWSKISKAKQEEMIALAAEVDLAKDRNDVLEAYKEITGENLIKDQTIQIQALNQAFNEGKLSLDSYNASMLELQATASNKRLEQGVGTSVDFMNVALNQMLDGYKSFQAESADLLGSVGSDLTTGIADSLGNAITKAEDLGDALKDVAENAIGSLISGLIKIGLQYAIMQAIGGGAGKSATADSVAQGAAVAAAWAPAAAAVSLASFGSNGIPAAAAVSGVNILSIGFASAGGKGFADGGYTGDGSKYQVAGTVHAGEYVFSKARTAAIGVDTLERLHKGYADGGYVSGSNVSGNVASINSGASTGDIQIINQTSAKVGSVQDGGLNEQGQRMIIIKEALDAVAASFDNPNSKISRKFKNNYKAKRNT